MRDISTFNNYSGTVAYDTSEDGIFLFLGDGSGNIADPSNNLPFTFADGDVISFEYRLPILEWAGSQNSLVGYSIADNQNAGLVPGFAEGVYTPSITVRSGSITAVTPLSSRYVRMGNTVMVTGTLDTLSDNASNPEYIQLGFTLPINSNFTATEDCRGVFGLGNTSAFAIGDAQFEGDSTNDECRLEVYIAGNSTFTVGYMFMYEVK